MKRTYTISLQEGTLYSDCEGCGLVAISFRSHLFKQIGCYVVQTDRSTVCFNVDVHLVYAKLSFSPGYKGRSLVVESHISPLLSLRCAKIKRCLPCPRSEGRPRRIYILFAIWIEA